MTADADPFDDLLGGGDPAPPASRRSRRSSGAAEALQQHIGLKAAASGRGLEDVGGVQALRRPVTINTLATIFEMDPQTVTKRLIDCPHTVQSGRKLFAFKEACSYIIKPKMTAEQFVKTLNASHLPPDLNKAFWDGQRSRLKYMIEAQEAWETHEVAAALGALCMTVKEALSTMTESMRERANLTDDQTEKFDAGIEDLRNRLAEKLTELADRITAPSMLGRPLFGTGDQAPPEPPEDDEFEDDD